MYYPPPQLNGNHITQWSRITRILIVAVLILDVLDSAGWLRLVAPALLRPAFGPLGTRLAIVVGDYSLLTLCLHLWTLAVFMSRSRLSMLGGVILATLAIVDPAHGLFGHFIANGGLGDNRAAYSRVGPFLAPQIVQFVLSCAILAGSWWLLRRSARTADAPTEVLRAS
jgi:hypothetical protein